jgi:hypothetical protein
VTERARCEAVVLGLHEKRAELLHRLSKYESELVEAAFKVKGTRTGSEAHFKALQGHERAKKLKTATQGELAHIKIQLHKASLDLDAAKRIDGDAPSEYYGNGLPVRPKLESTVSPVDATESDLLHFVHAMSEIHDKYAQFAKDPTRINSMRHMAGEVARDIAALLKGRRK